MEKTINRTHQTYSGLTAPYDLFNARLFAGKLPACLITVQRQNKAYGYFAGGRFGARDGREITDEIAFNPTHFRARPAAGKPGSSSATSSTPAARSNALALSSRNPASSCAMSSCGATKPRARRRRRARPNTFIPIAT